MNQICLSNNNHFICWHLLQHLMTQIIQTTVLLDSVCLGYCFRYLYSGTCIPSAPILRLNVHCPLLLCLGRLMVGLYFLSYCANFVWASRFVYLLGPTFSALGITFETFWPACRLFCISHHFVHKKKEMTNKWGSKNRKSKKLSKEHHYIYKSTQMSELFIWSARKKFIVTLSYKIFFTVSPSLKHANQWSVTVGLLVATSLVTVSYWEFSWALVLRAENNHGCVMAVVQRRVRVRVMGLGASWSGGFIKSKIERLVVISGPISSQDVSWYQKPDTRVSSHTHTVEDAQRSAHTHGCVIGNTSVTEWQVKGTEFRMLGFITSWHTHTHTLDLWRLSWLVFRVVTMKWSNVSPEWTGGREPPHFHCRLAGTFTDYQTGQSLVCLTDTKWLPRGDGEQTCLEVRHHLDAIKEMQFNLRISIMNESV